MELVAQKAAIEQMQKEFAFSERRACGLLPVAVSTYRYETRRNDEPLRSRLLELARERPRFGYRRLHAMLNPVGGGLNHKRIHRLYRECGLTIRRRKRKHWVRKGQPLVARTAPNQEWGMDFVHDRLECGRAIRWLIIGDAFTRECLALEVDTSFPSRRVTRVLDAIAAQRGLPAYIRCDNGPELTSRHFLAWAAQRRVEMLYIQPGKPTQNGRAESQNGKIKDEYLVPNLFTNLFDARYKAPLMRNDYNEVRPHSSLGYLTPAAFAAKYWITGCGNDGGCAALDPATRDPHSHSTTAAVFPLGTQTQDRVSSTVA